MNIERLKKIYSWLLNNKARITNRLFGSSNYKKFVIISRSRTGSTLLMALLNKHNNIICQGELFKKLNGNSCYKIWNDFFSKKPKRIKFVGFKLFYYHPFDEDKEVWDYITKDKNLTIIHLTRKNYLEAYLSQKIGEKTKQWSESKFKPHKISLKEKIVTLNANDCEKTFRIIKNYENETVERFKNHKFIEIDYKDLNNSKEKTISSIFEELELPIEKVKVVNKKQNNESVSQLIENYQELKEKFSETEWNYLFE